MKSLVAFALLAITQFVIALSVAPLPAFAQDGSHANRPHADDFRRGGGADLPDQRKPIAARYDIRDPLIINQASELVPWCKSEAEAAYIGLGYTPFQWTASYHDYSNHLYVDGRLRVHGEDIDVKCTITRGARARYINVSIDDPIVANATRKAHVTP